MADDLTSRGGRDRARIDIHQDYELRDWSKKFGVSPEELKKAVADVGTEADKVEVRLRESKSGSNSARDGSSSSKER